jgi:alkylation response protein AidB-like acyl-CoA dehydrogenase
MEFELSDWQREIQRVVREFAAGELAPIAARIDETAEFPAEAIKKAAELGLLGLPIPEQYGGAGADNLSYALAIEEIAKACASTAVTIAAHTALVTFPIYLYGTEEQKQKYLVPLARGDMLGAFGLTEPEAGSDAGATQTRAVLRGDEWVINGSKTFITSGSVAGVVVITARTDQAPGTDGISAILVEQGTPGFRIGRTLAKMGLHGSVTNELFFEDCRVPAANLLGERGQGFRQFLVALDGGRIGIGAVSVGVAQAAFDYALAYAKNRVQFGKPIAELQAIQFMLAEMATQIEAARLLVWRAAYLKDKGQPFRMEASMAKMFASEMGERVCHQAIQILGGYGYMREYPVERMYRDIRLMEIGEGTSQVQRLVIARQLLKSLS